MHSTLIVARMDPGDADAVAARFAEFDAGPMPGRMGTRRRELFRYRGLYFHLQDFDDAPGEDAIEAAKGEPEFVRISTDLKAYIQAYDPVTWRSPKDAMADRFYHWSDR